MGKREATAWCAVPKPGDVMSESEAVGIYYDASEMEGEALLAVAREAQRRTLAEVRAVPVETLVAAARETVQKLGEIHWEKRRDLPGWPGAEVDTAIAEAVRRAILAAIGDGAAEPGGGGR